MRNLSAFLAMVFALLLFTACAPVSAPQTQEQTNGQAEEVVPTSPHAACAKEPFVWDDEAQYLADKVIVTLCPVASDPDVLPTLADFADVGATELEILCYDYDLTDPAARERYLAAREGEAFCWRVRLTLSAPLYKGVDALNAREDVLRIEIMDFRDAKYWEKQEFQPIENAALADYITVRFCPPYRTRHDAPRLSDLGLENAELLCTAQRRVGFDARAFYWEAKISFENPTREELFAACQMLLERKDVFYAGVNREDGGVAYRKGELLVMLDGDLVDIDTEGYFQPLSPEEEQAVCAALGEEIELELVVSWNSKDSQNKTNGEDDDWIFIELKTKTIEEMDRVTTLLCQRPAVLCVEEHYPGEPH